MTKMGKADFVPTLPRERILAATIDLIEQVGPNKLTTRSIAVAAGVNVAAINYYFRSKDALLEAALASSWDHAAGHLRDYISTEPWDPRVALSGIAEFLFEGGLRFPVVMKANFFDGEGRVRAHIATAIAALSHELEDRLASVLKRPVDIQLRIRVSVFLSALLFPPLASTSLPLFDDEVGRVEYVHVLVDDLLASLGVVEGGTTV
jgi:TetR/AcrR family transcriptional regulator, regulator of cefoperazone and chloramphenicol sensitivity